MYFSNRINQIKNYKKMEKIKLKIRELMVLVNEVNILLPNKLNHLFKLELIELFERVSKVLEPVDKIKQELIKSNIGTIKEGLTEEEVSKLKGYREFQTKFNEVVNEERELSYIPVKRKYLDFESELVLVQFYKLLEKDAKLNEEDNQIKNPLRKAKSA